MSAHGLAAAGCFDIIGNCVSEVNVRNHYRDYRVLCCALRSSWTKLLFSFRRMIFIGALQSFVLRVRLPCVLKYRSTLCV